LHIYYSAFIAAKVLALDDTRPVPSQTMYDGHNCYPTNKWVLFGHHLRRYQARAR
jgi:carbon starvation protein